MNEETKICSVCKKEKPLLDFYLRRDRNKRISRCKKCNRNASVDSWKRLTDEEKKLRYAENKKWRDEQINGGNLKVYMTSKLCSYKSNAAKQNLPFNLDIQYLIDLFNKQRGVCYYTGDVLTMQSNRGFGKNCISLPSNKTQASLDRMTPSDGYVKGNVVWCGWLVNTCKNMLNKNEFYEMCRKVLKYEN